MKRCYFWGFYFLLTISVFAQENPTARWMNIGSYDNVYGSRGSEPEEFLVKILQYGMRYPAWYPYQDMQNAKALWIGVKDFDSPGNYETALIGPRNQYDNLVETKFKVYNKYRWPEVFVNGQLSELIQKDGVIDSTLTADKLIYNELNSALGITIKREIFQFSQEYHDNYIVNKYTFINSGNTDADPEIERPDKDIAGAYFYFLYKMAICHQVRYVIGNGSGWGMNTMIDIRGDGKKITDDNPENLRFQYAWHGNFPWKIVNYDNVGGPVFYPDPYGYTTNSDTTGRLGAYQFPGILTLHADKSGVDHTDDPGQPSTTDYVSYDDRLLNAFFNLDEEYYELMSKGHANPFHADVVEPDGNYATATGDPALNTSGGFASANGYGPYDIAFGDSITIIIVEGADGLSVEKAYEIGKNYKDGIISAEEKNEWVLTGKDSLITTFTRAMSNYQSGWNIPMPPKPPKKFSVNKVAGGAELSWELFENSGHAGFEIYRTISEDADYFQPGVWNTKYDLIASLDKDARNYVDLKLKSGIDYYYYLQVVGKPEDNNGTGLTPEGIPLRSGRFYAQTYDPVSVITSVEENVKPKDFYVYDNYPNPFNPSTKIDYYLPERSKVTVKVYDLLGQPVAELYDGIKTSGRHSVIWRAAGSSSGVYILSIEIKEETSGKFYSARKKMVLMK